MKALVGAFNQEKALVGAFSVIVQPVVEPMDRFTALLLGLGPWPAMEYHHHYLGRVAPICSYRQHTAAGRKQVLCVIANAELQMSLADWLGLGAPFLLDI